MTRHLRDELEHHSDWDVMFLHYLGLDHIGHLSGPKSPLVLPKLIEMDNIVKFVYESLQSQVRINISAVCTLYFCFSHLIVVGYIFYPIRVRCRDC